MCTVVCRWAPLDPFPVQMLTLRDELLSRSFDLPGSWWPDQSDVVGGRDRFAGGSWCVSDVAAGVTGVVLNRPDRPVAEPGAASRGVLPLTAVRSPEHWLDTVDRRGMASFNLVVATPRSLRWWWFDGDELTGQDLAAGTYMFTPRGRSPSDAMDPRFTSSHGTSLDDADAPTGRAWGPWLDVVRESVRDADPIAMLVRQPVGDDSFETVFGQLVAARPGVLRLDYSIHPDSTEPWTTKYWRSQVAASSGGN